MSIHPIKFNNTTRIYTMSHDEANHTFDILESDIALSEDNRVASIQCLLCDSNSWHPVSGGADPPNIQPMFVQLYVTKLGLSVDEAIDKAKQYTLEIDGEGRWQVNEEKLHNAT